ncbi:hypothetical protein SteCoe_369 [Stentor coeruleus]|uniref:Uncharacterized protein n=1 Tax=Stentor coeruleus TaxID=5963 RepID=A0A1R2D4J2_9CILI|nr:hypothetical protein SteCoe_369 [Stentor coeruleus]
MAKTFDFDSLSSLSLTYDICSSIDNSYLTKRISRLNPYFLFETKSRTKSIKHKKKGPSDTNTKIIPELRAVVDILKNRLNSTTELTLVSRPCTRYKADNREVISPGKYHRHVSSTGGHAFSKSPRLHDTIAHQLSKLATNKFKPFPGDIEKKNKKEAKNAKKYFKSVREKNKSHNEKVNEVVKSWKIKSFMEMEQKKQDLITKMENIKWKENKELIFKAKTNWSKIIIDIAFASIINTKIRIKIHKAKRLRKLIVYLQIMSKILGKFGKILKRKRKFLEYKNVRSVANPMIEWIEHERVNLSKTVSRNVWKIVNNNHLFLLLHFWKKNILKIQHHVRRYLTIREARVVVMTQMYNKLITSHGPKDNRRSALVLTNFLGILNVAPASKRRIVIEYMRSYLHNYAKDVIENGKKSLRLYLNKEAMISYFLIASNGLQNSIKGRKKNAEFFSHFK